MYRMGKLVRVGGQVRFFATFEFYLVNGWIIDQLTTMPKSVVEVWIAKHRIFTDPSQSQLFKLIEKF